MDPFIRHRPLVPLRSLCAVAAPSTARELDIDREHGVAKVEVAPIVVPQADGSLKPGAAADLPLQRDTAAATPRR
jgi:hypothetical protein